jgi:hypothetical protein
MPRSYAILCEVNDFELGRVVLGVARRNVRGAPVTKGIVKITVVCRSSAHVRFCHCHCDAFHHRRRLRQSDRDLLVCASEALAQHSPNPRGLGVCPSEVASI